MLYIFLTSIRRLIHIHAIKKIEKEIEIGIIIINLSHERNNVKTNIQKKRAYKRWKKGMVIKSI